MLWNRPPQVGALHMANMWCVQEDQPLEGSMQRQQQGQKPSQSGRSIHEVRQDEEPNPFQQD